MWHRFSVSDRYPRLFSLQATWIRNSLLHALRDTTRINTRTIPSNFVYRYPTIAQLSSFVSGLASSDYDDEDFATHDKAVEAMLEMVEKYTKDFPAHVPSAPAPKKDVVLLTGTTGGLGASLLFSLVDSPDVERIYAVNRKGEGSLESRQKSVLEERGIDVERVLTSSKVKYVEIDLGDHLGFDEVLLEEVSSADVPVLLSILSFLSLDSHVCDTLCALWYATHGSLYICPD